MHLICNLLHDFFKDLWAYYESDMRPTLPTPPMPRVHRCYTKKYGVIIKKTSKQLESTKKTSSKKHILPWKPPWKKDGKNKPNSQQQTNTHPFPGWCHCRFGYGFGHWTCQFLGFMATRWSKTWTWWYPRCDGRFEAWHHSWYRGGVGSMGSMTSGVEVVRVVGPCGLMYLEILPLGLICKCVEMKEISSRFCRVERHRQIQPGSTCDLGSRYQPWCDFRVFVQREVWSSWKRRQFCLPCHSNFITIDKPHLLVLHSKKTPTKAWNIPQTLRLFMKETNPFILEVPGGICSKRVLLKFSSKHPQVCR